MSIKSSIYSVGRAFVSFVSVLPKVPLHYHGRFFSQFNKKLVKNGKNFTETVLRLDETDEYPPGVRCGVIQVLFLSNFHFLILLRKFHYENEWKILEWEWRRWSRWDMSWSCLVGESLSDGRELIFQNAETGSIFGTVWPALFHDLKQIEDLVKICWKYENFVGKFEKFDGKFGKNFFWKINKICFWKLKKLYQLTS